MTITSVREEALADSANIAAAVAVADTGYDDAVALAHQCHLELQSLLDLADNGQPVDPVELGTATHANDISARQVDSARKAKEQAHAAHRAMVNDRLMDKALVTVQEGRRLIDADLALVAEALTRFRDTVRSTGQRTAFAHGNLSSNVQTDSSPRFSNGHGGVRVDGQRIHPNTKGAVVEILRLVAPIVAMSTDLAPLAQAIQQTARVENGLGPAR